MARPNRINERREEFLAITARAFAQLGYRRTTTAELAQRCGIPENVLFRVWPTKKAIFLASIDHVFASSEKIWKNLLAKPEPGRTNAQRLLEYESTHLGEFGLYRVLFAGLSDTDDPEIREALTRTYRNFHEFIGRVVEEHQAAAGGGSDVDPQTLAWALLGVGTISHIINELNLISPEERHKLILSIGQRLLQ